MLFLYSSTVCCHIFVQVCQGISRRLDHGCAPWFTGSCLRPQTNGVVNIVGGKALFLKFFGCEIFRELMDDGAYDLHVSQFFCTCIGKKIAPKGKARKIGGFVGLENWCVSIIGVYIIFSYSPSSRIIFMT